MAILTAQDIPATGLDKTTMVAADVAGDFFPNDGKTLFFIKNASGAAITATVDSIGLCSHGFDHNLSINVPAGKEILLPKLDPPRFNDENGRVKVTYSAVSSITVAAVRS